MGKNTVKARVQLKNDTEANWNKSSFVPLPGEVIIYTADDSHPFFRLKIGDGETPVTLLPFIEAGALDGMTSDNLVAQKVSHTLTFGAHEAFTYDGSQDVTVPVYSGTFI